MVKNLYLYGEIGWEISAINVQKFVDSLATDDELVIYINSPGGSVFEGLTIYNILSAVKNKKTVKVIGLAASMASVVACMRGAAVDIADNAMMLVHNPWTYAWAGDADYYKKLAEDLEKIKTQIIKAYTEKTGKSEQEISDLMAIESYLNSAESTDWKFADSIYTPGKEEQAKMIYKFAALSREQFTMGTNQLNTSNINNDLSTNKEAIIMPLNLDEAVRENEALKISVASLTTDKDKIAAQVTEVTNQLEAAKLKHSGVEASMLKQISELQDKVLTQEIDTFMAANNDKITPAESGDLKAKLILLKRNEETMKLNDTKSLYQMETELIAGRAAMNLDKRLPVQDVVTDIPTDTKFASLDITSRDGQKEANKRIEAYMKDNPAVSYDEAFTHLMTT